VKIQAYNIIQILASYFDIVAILEDEEPTIAKDLLNTVISDAQNLIDPELCICAFQLANSTLFKISDKLEFVKANEQ
jgi:hypothetical protein